MLNFFKSFHRAATLLAVVGLTFGVSSLIAAERPELSDKVSSGIPALTALFEAKKWDEAVASIDALIAKVAPNSLDRAFLLGLKTQVMGTKGDLNAAVASLEEMVRIADEQKLFPYGILPMREQDAVMNLASINMGVGSSAKEPQAQRDAYAKAHIYAKRLVEYPKPTLEAQSLWARLLYSEASVDSSKVDMTIMKQALDAADQALHMTIKPKEEQYSMYLATLQQLGDNKRFAEVLELMVALFPNNKSYWPMLFNTYNMLQSTGDKTADVAAVVTLERAQAVGQMVSNKDNYMLTGMYYNIGRYEYAADLLEKGLRNGKIDSEQKNWELLSNCYQQLNKPDRAVDTLKQAIKVFPKSATLEQQVGQIFYNTERREESYKHFRAAVDKGLTKPAPTLVIISYLAMEMKNLDEALVQVEKALVADPKSKDAQNLMKAIKTSIDDREKFKKQK